MYFNIDSVCAVIITYFPDYGFKQRLEKITKQVKHCIIVDNGSIGVAALTIEEALKENAKVELIKNIENFGVASALNHGVKIALEYGFLWVVTFDQDSVPEMDMVKKMLRAWRAYPEPAKLMIAGPQTVFPNCSPSSAQIKADMPWIEVTHVITSGSLISAQAFEAVGYFLDSLFIDYVDIEFCIRLRNKGYQIIQVPDAILLHDLGKISEHNIFGRHVRTTHHEPVRRYYQFRNSLLLHKVYKKIQAEWCRCNRMILFKIICLILLYENRKSRKIAQIMKGILHGLLGRAGRSGEAHFNYTDSNLAP